MEDIKHWMDIVSSIIICTVVSFFTWLDVAIPHITMWLSFVSMLLSVCWWLHRWYRLYKLKHHD